MPFETPDIPNDLVALVGSRLCHDLISPLSAISNGVELMEMAGMGKSPEFALIAESVAAANAKLKFFRVAFGKAADGQSLSEREVGQILADMSAAGRLKIEPVLSGDQPRDGLKMCFLALLCLEAALPWGGTVSVAHTGGRWTIRGEAPRTKPDPDLWARLDGTAVELRPAQVQFALLAEAAAERGTPVTWDVTETSAWVQY